MKPARQPEHERAEELASMQANFEANVKVVELFENDVPHVRTDKVVKPTGMPPAEWALS